MTENQPTTKPRTLAELNEIHKNMKVNSLTEDEYVAKYRPVDSETDPRAERERQRLASEAAEKEEAVAREKHEAGARAAVAAMIEGGGDAAVDRVLAKMRAYIDQARQMERKNAGAIVRAYMQNLSTRNARVEALLPQFRASLTNIAERIENQ